MGSMEEKGKKGPSKGKFMKFILGTDICEDNIPLRPKVLITLISFHPLTNAQLLRKSLPKWKSIKEVWKKTPLKKSTPKNITLKKIMMMSMMKIMKKERKVNLEKRKANSEKRKENLAKKKEKMERKGKKGGKKGKLGKKFGGKKGKF